MGRGSLVFRMVGVWVGVGNGSDGWGFLNFRACLEMAVGNCVRLMGIVDSLGGSLL